jgi:tetratricopeptide (TPR) repeat protein
VSVVPADIAGIGSSQQKLRVVPGFDALKAGVGPEEYFVLSRIDGTQTIRDVLLTTGLPVDRAIAIILRLRSIGALLLPGESAPAQAPIDRPSQPLQRRSTGQIAVPRTSTAQREAALPPAPSHDLSLPGLTAEERAALAEDVELPVEARRLLLAMARLLDNRDPHALLGAAAGADEKALRRAYFQLSKSIHPDRYFGKRLGSFGPLLAHVFEATSRAYAKLTTPEKASGSGPTRTSGSVAADAQTPQEYAAELFERACQLEVGGDALGAMKLFAATVRVDPQPRYLRRAASCALAAKQPRTAVEYATKAQAAAPNDPSSARLLAAAFRAAGKLADAEEVLVLAMALKSENDTLGAELARDLAEVRRLLAQ